MEFHGSGESEAPRAVGAERGFVLTQSPVQHLQGWMSSACWFLLCSWGQVLHLGFLWNSCSPLQLGALSTLPILALSRQQSLGSTRSSPSTPSSGSLSSQILSLSFSQAPLTRSTLPHPHLGCQAVGFACTEGPGSAWGWEPLSCPTLRESEPICWAVCVQLPVLALGLSVCPDASFLGFLLGAFCLS